VAFQIRRQIEFRNCRNDLWERPSGLEDREQELAPTMSLSSLSALTPKGLYKIAHGKRSAAMGQGIYRIHIP